MSAFCFCFLAADLAHGKNSQLDYSSLLKPFLAFKSHITTVLIAQNAAKASKIDWSVHLFTQKPFVSSYFRLEWYFTYCVARNLGLTDSSDLGLGKTLTVNCFRDLLTFTCYLIKDLSLFCIMAPSANGQGRFNLDDTDSHGLQTPNEGINQRNLKFWVDVTDKICFGRT